MRLVQVAVISKLNCFGGVDTLVVLIHYNGRYSSLDFILNH